MFVISVRLLAVFLVFGLFFSNFADAAFFAHRAINTLPPFEANESFNPNFYIHSLWASGHLNYTLQFRNPLPSERSFAVVVGGANGEYNETKIVRLKPGEHYFFTGVAAPVVPRKLWGEYGFSASAFLLREPANESKVEQSIFRREMSVPADWAGFVGLDAPNGKKLPGVEFGGLTFALALFAVAFVAWSKLGAFREKALLAGFLLALFGLFAAFAWSSNVFYSETGFLPGSPDTLMHTLKARLLQESWQNGGQVESHAFAYWEAYLPGLHYFAASVATLLGTSVEFVYLVFAPLLAFSITPLLIFLVARRLFKKTSVSALAALLYLFATAAAPFYFVWGIWAQELNTALVLLALLVALKFFETKNPLVLGGLAAIAIFAWFEHFPGGAMLLGLVAVCFAAFAFQSVSVWKKIGLAIAVVCAIALFVSLGGLQENNAALVYRLLVGKSEIPLQPVDQWHSPAFSALAFAGIALCFFASEKRKEKLSFAAAGALAFGAFALSLNNPQMFLEGFARIAFVSSALLAPFAGFALAEAAGFAGRVLKSEVASAFVVFAVLFWALFFWNVAEMNFYPRETGYALYSASYNEFAIARVDEKIYPTFSILKFLGESKEKLDARGVDLVVAGGDPAYFTNDAHYACLAVSVITRVDCIGIGFDLEKDSASKTDAERLVSDALEKAPAKKPVVLTSLKPEVLGKPAFASLDFGVGNRVYHYYFYEWN